jgi:hypothetical protein
MNNVYIDNYTLLRKKFNHTVPTFKHLGLQTLYDFRNWCVENYYYWSKNVLSLNLGVESIRTLWLLFWADNHYNLRWNDNLKRWIKENEN